MSEITLKIDGKDVRASERMTILEAAKSAGINIPTLCHHEKLKPYPRAGFVLSRLKKGGG